MSNKVSMKIFTFFLVILLLTLSIYYTKNLKLDASSDTLILKEDSTFKYFEYYNNIFPSKNFLVLAVKSESEINDTYINNINNIIEKINKLENVESTFSIINAPILIENNRVLSTLAGEEIENINNTSIKLENILNEFTNNPIYQDQLIIFLP